MKKIAIVVGLAATLFAGAAQAMTVQAFLDSAARIPRNPTALLRSDTRRLMDEVKGSMASLRTEQTATRAAGRTPASCMPERVRMSPDEILQRFNSIPADRRRTMQVSQAMREWMAERYPCSA